MSSSYQYPRVLPPSREPAELLRRQRIEYEVAQNNLARATYYNTLYNSLASSSNSSSDNNEEDEKKGKKTTRNIIIIIVIILILLIIGIGSGIAIYYFFFRSKKSSSSSTVSVQCTTDSECGSGSKCIDNVCKGDTGASCIAFIDCISGICTSGVCKGTLNSTCSIDTDCSPPFVCTNNQCQPKSCTLTSDCGSNQQCNSPILPDCILNFKQPCTIDTECDIGMPDTVGLRCSNRMCLRTGGGACSVGSDCVSGICTGGLCKCQSATTDCLSGQICTAGDCTPIVPVVYG